MKFRITQDEKRMILASRNSIVTLSVTSDLSIEMRDFFVSEFLFDLDEVRGRRAREIKQMLDPATRVFEFPTLLYLETIDGFELTSDPITIKGYKRKLQRVLRYYNPSISMGHVDDFTIAAFKMI